MNIEKSIEHVYNKFKKEGGGKNAQYIPALSKVNPKLYAISICTVNGDKYDIGDYNTLFAIESTSKVFSLALALEKFGPNYLREKIGDKPSHLPFNSVKAIESLPTHASNSFSNAGAMATTCLSYKNSYKKNHGKFQKVIVDYMSKFAGKQLYVSKEVYNSEFSLADHNFALAYLLKSYSRFDGDVPTCVDVYTRQCSVMVTSQDLSVMAATIANGGINPITKKHVIDNSNVPYIIDQMYKNGLYNESEEFNGEAGVPGKSGVGGAIMLVIPGVMGIGIFSPPLNDYGNSYKGVKTAVMLSNVLNLKKKYVNFS
jgi:glutaminase